MSYKRPNTGDTLNDLIITICDFNNIAPNLIKAKTNEAYLLWLFKCIEINKRTCLLWLRKHKSKISKERIQLAQQYFIQEI